jgi:hypothetical protein
MCLSRAVTDIMPQVYQNASDEVIVFESVYKIDAHTYQRLFPPFSQRMMGITLFIIIEVVVRYLKALHTGASFVLSPLTIGSGFGGDCL